MEKVTIEKLQKENETLRSELKAAEEKSAADAQTISNLQAEVEVVSDVNADLTKKVEELSAPKTVTEAAEKLEEVKKAVLPTETFEVAGEKYQFISPVFMLNKRRITAEEALLDQELLNELVKIGSGAIVKA